MSSDDVLIYEVTDGLAWLTLNRPQARNALDSGLRAALAAAFRRFAGDDRARIEGRGPLAAGLLGERGKVRRGEAGCRKLGELEDSGASVAQVRASGGGRGCGRPRAHRLILISAIAPRRRGKMAVTSSV